MRSDFTGAGALVRNKPSKLIWFLPHAKKDATADVLSEVALPVASGSEDQIQNDNHDQRHAHKPKDNSGKHGSVSCLG
jgi:hypothetical protein